MTVDRFGDKIYTAWSTTEILWIDAAISLDRAEHAQAFADIADLTGRSIHAVQTRAYKLFAQKLDAMADLRDRARRQRGIRTKDLAPSCIAAPTKAQMMRRRP